MERTGSSRGALQRQKAGPRRGMGGKLPGFRGVKLVVTPAAVKVGLGERM